MDGIARSAARPNQLKVGGQVFPGFISYEGDDSGIDVLSGLVQHSASIKIGFTPDNPQDLDDRQNQSFWCFGQEINILILDSTGNYKLHPRGKLYLISSFWDAEVEELNLECGCLINLLRNLSAEDFDNRELIQNPELGLTDEEKDKLESRDWRNEYNKAKWHSTSNIVSKILGKIGLRLTTGGASGRTRGPFQISGSLLESVGELMAKTTSPQFVWCNNAGQLITSPINKNLPVFSTFLIGGEEVSYKPIDKGLSAIDKLIVSGTIPIASKKKPEDATITTNADGFEEKYSITEERGPESVITRVSSAFDMVFAIVERTETRNQFQKIAKTTRTERLGLVFPSLKTRRSEFVVSSKQIQNQYFDLNGRLTMEDEVTLGCFGNVFNGYLTKYKGYFCGITKPILPPSYGTALNDIAFSYPAVGNNPVDFYINDETLILSTYKTTFYQYGDDDEIQSKTTTTWAPISTVALGYIYLKTDYAVTKIEVESWQKWGRNESHTLITKEPNESKYSDAVASLEVALFKALAVKTYAAIQIYTTDDQGNISYTIGETKDLPYPQVTIDERMALMSGEDLLDQSRVGLANTPATEYLPKFSGKDDPSNTEKAEDWEEQTVNAVRIWAKPFHTHRPPRERTNVGKIENISVLQALADAIYFIRQGESKLYQLILPLTDKWLSNTFSPFMRIEVIEPNGNSISFLAHGFCWTMDEATNLVSFDCLWLGGLPSSFVSPSSSGGYELEIDAA